MRIETLPIPALALALPLWLPSDDGVAADGPTVALSPPSCVLIKGGRTKIGSEPKEIEQLLASNDALRGMVQHLDAETPQHEVTVSDFYLMVTELTNEQYHAFVQETGRRPPLSWADPAAVEAARLAFFEENQRKKLEARAQGRTHEDGKFIAQRWWERNWQDQPWAMTPAMALLPVTWVDYADATAYCRWAGLRLPTEFEFQRAVRGSGKDPYPWGAWESGRAATFEDRSINSTTPAGKYAGGVSSDGVFDLVGNVWEWTSSPYLPYERFKRNIYKVGRGRGGKELTGEPFWDPNQRVVVGGSFGVDRTLARCTVRRATERSQTTEGMGFRCAATPRAGADAAEVVYRFEVANSPARVEGADFLVAAPIALDRWEMTTSSSEKAPEGYGVITAYDHFAFVPVERLEAVSSSELTRASLESPLQFGFLTTSEAMVEPELPPGTYLLSYRAAGKPPRARAAAAQPAAGPDGAPQEGDAPAEAEVPEVEDPLLAQIDITRDNFLLFDARSGELAASLPVPAMSFGRGSEPDQVSFVDKTITVEVENAEGELEKVQKVEKWLRLRMNVPARTRNTFVETALEMKPHERMPQMRWRSSR